MANPVIKGIHHITLCASGAQEDVDFCTQVLGQRLIKQTVLFDGRYAHYHLYYANANAEVGSVLTTFPYKRVPGRQGSGQISSTAYTAPKGAISSGRNTSIATRSSTAESSNDSASRSFDSSIRRVC